MLRRFERDLLIAWGALTLGAFVVTWGRAEVAASVAAGGALMGASYLGIKSGADLLAAVVVRPGASGGEMPGTPGSPQTASCESVERAGLAEGAETGSGAKPPRHALVVAALKFLGRFALLALLAYGMLAVLRLHPVGLLVGASAPFVAVAAQLIHLRRR